MVLNEKNEIDVEKSLSMLREFCRVYQLEVNCSKTKIMQINFKVNYSWVINTMQGQKILKKVDDYKYLGFEINAKGNNYAYIVRE